MLAPAVIMWRALFGFWHGAPLAFPVLLTVLLLPPLSLLLCHCQAVVLLLAEDDDTLALAAWQACEALAGTIPKEEQAGHVAALKEAMAGAREKERRKRRPGPLQLHGLLLAPKALGPFVPIHLQGVLQVSTQNQATCLTAATTKWAWHKLQTCADQCA